MLELIFQGFMEWAYGLALECWEYFSSSLLDIMSMDYADPGCATVYKVTENALSELLGRAPNLYVPPRTQFLTEKGDVVDAPLIKAPGKAGGPHRK